MPQPLLEAYVVPDDSVVLRRKIDQLEVENRQLRDELRESRNQCAAVSSGVSALRRQLEPLYNALRMVFGEIEVAGVGSPGEATSGVSPKIAAVWQSWINKLGGKRAEVIKALLEHGELSVVQLKVMTHSSGQTVYNQISSLNQLGLINKNGGKFSLKEL